MAVKVVTWKGAYWLDVVHKGRRKRRRVGTGKAGKKAAELAATRIAARLAEGDMSIFDPPKAAGPAPTFATIAEEWRRKYPLLHALRPNTMDNYGSFTETHLLPFFGDRPITAITPEAIEDFIEAKRAPGGSVRRPGKALSDASLRTGLLALRLILQRAVKVKVIPANPMKEVEFRLAPRIDQVDPFSGPEVRALLDGARTAVGPDAATMLRLWAQTGMRAGEMCGLQWQDIDLEQGTALVQRTWSRQRLGPTKTGHARVVSLLHPVADDTADWRPGATDAARSVLAGLRSITARSREPEAFVFGQDSGQHSSPLSSMEMHRRWRRALAKARVRYRVPEQLRHTFASTMLSRNAPLLYVQHQGGWRSASVLLRVYARWLPQAAGISALLPPCCHRRRPTPLRLGPPEPRNYLTMQNPCASMPSATLNFERKFSRAAAAVSSTICASEKWVRTRANSASSTRRPVTVIASAYSSAAFSRSLKRSLVSASGTCAILASDAPACIPRDALMSIQKGQPLMSATRR
ncbi:MAG: hypothetical protein DMD94_00415 [Candidatus Rokuibacteriota bacterium]|nr:MAG: hypothetical protein DMD94_00415 [Candidatus Rokubacteria bacterium]